MHRDLGSNNCRYYKQHYMEHQKSVQYLLNRREFYFATLVSLYAKQQHLIRSSTLAFSFYKVLQQGENNNCQGNLYYKRWVKGIEMDMHQIWLVRKVY